MDATFQRRKVMEKAFEFIDPWLRSQKNFLDNWTGSQKELMDNWIESIKKIQLSFGTMADTRRVSPQLLERFNSWYITMLSSSRAFTEGITDLQNAWKTTIEKQMEMSKEFAKQFLDLAAKVEKTEQESTA
jgi:predicted solute-binding protein